MSSNRQPHMQTNIAVTLSIGIDVSRATDNEECLQVPSSEDGVR